MTGILWGLLGASFIGVSDCVARVTAQRVSLSILLGAVMGLSTLVLTAWMAVNGGWPQWEPYGWLASAISGLLNLVALFFLYTALARGPVTVASPATSTFSVLLLALNAAAGHPVGWQQAGAGALVFLGVIMLARRNSATDSYSAAHLRLTALFGLLAALAVAARMFLAQDAADILGSLEALYLNRAFALAGVIVLVGFEAARGIPRRWPTDANVIWLIVVQALLESLALASFLVGSAEGDRVGATIGFAAFSAVTALSAWLWLGEPIGWRRGFWMAVVALGIAIAMSG